MFSLCSELADLLPGIINQMGPDSLNNLKRMAAQMQVGRKVSVFFIIREANVFCVNTDAACKLNMCFLLLSAARGTADGR